jgi:hypothetical protein
MSLIFLPIYIHTCNEEEELLVLSVSAGDRIWVDYYVGTLERTYEYILFLVKE